MYYVLRCLDPIGEDGGYMEIEDYVDISGFDDWGIGIKGIDFPVGKVVINAIPKEGYKGKPREFSDFTIPIMSDRLKKILENTGVDNLKYYPIDLINTETNEIYNYHAFNLIGLVSATDLSKSDISSYDEDNLGDSSIKDFILDESKTQNLLMFRLAEKFSVILIHDKVRKSIEDSGIDTLTFIKPEDYYHL